MRPLDDRTLRILYRGRLSSCNFDCAYCPFAKRRDSAETLRRDAAELARFVDWARGAGESLAILFTPWGEGLVRRHYREALVALSHLSHVRRVAIQTNLNAPLEWVQRANPDTLALWCTYHPSQITRQRFLRQLARLRKARILFSVGMVGATEHYDEIKALRATLPPDEYLWVNALDPRPEGYYSQESIAWLTQIDPHFSFNLAPPPSLGAACRAGDTMISVDGEGQVRPCHFVTSDLGNLYDGSFLANRRSTVCPNLRCDCYIGYIHRKDLMLQTEFGDGVMARILQKTGL